MFKHLSILPIFAALVCGTACGEEVSKSTGLLSSASEKSSSDKDKDSGGSTSGSSDTKIPATGDFEIALDEVVTQAAPWGDVEISVDGARLVRGKKPAGFPADVKHSNKKVYAILDLQLEAKGSTDTDYRERDTWDLVLANGKRVTPLNPVGKLLQPGDDVPASLFYEVAGDVSLSGAELEVNGSDRDVLEPLRIPLDEKKTFESQVELSEIVGDSFEVDDGGAFRFEIVDATFGVNLQDSGRRAPRDKRLVGLTVKVEHAGDNSLSFDASDAPRLSVGERSIAAEDFTAKKIAGGKSAEVALIYAIDEGASDFDLVVDLGEEELSTKSVSLPSLLEDEFESADDDGARSDGDSASDDSDDEDSAGDDDKESFSGDSCGCGGDDSEESFDTDDEFETDDSFDFSDDEEFDGDESGDDDEFVTDDEENSEEGNQRN